MNRLKIKDFLAHIFLVTIPLTAPPAQAQWAATQEELDFAPSDFQIIQHYLSAFGYAVSVDGQFGPQTDAAIYQFLHDAPPEGTYTREVVLIPFMEDLHRSGWRRPTSGSLVTPQRNSTNPSFNCQKAQLPTEHAICASSALAALDRQIAEHYQRVLRYVSSSGRVLTKAEQKDWLLRRDACGANFVCLKTVMQERADVLSYQGR